MTTTCCYEGCEKTAIDYDTDGDDACAEHAAKSERYVIAESSFGQDGDSLDETHVAPMVAALEALGFDVEIRSTRRNEAPGTYSRKRDGSLQILGYSIPVPDEFTHAYREAWNRVVC